jgi:signal transduction histidine kinase
MQQARFAALGEMIGNIAHQWRQPLSAISSISSGMQLQMELGLTTDEEINNSYKKILNNIEFLSQTIEDFRGFFKEDKENVDFNVVDIINKTVPIIEASYKDNNIILHQEIENDTLISHGMPSELSQVFLNILNNAKDATVSNNPKERNVYLHATCNDKYNIVTIQDNAGGIPLDIIEKIFDPYFTTKHQSQGTGIGLYMSKDIVENHMHGQISVKNISRTIGEYDYDGACFIVKIPKATSHSKL